MKKLMALACVLILPTMAFSQSMDDLKKMATSDEAQSAMDSMGGSLSGLLQGGLDVTEDQADGSIGSMMSLASQKLSAGDYDKFANMIPGADKYLESAKSLGAVAEPLASLGDFNNALSSLGISAETVEKYVPMITEYVGKLGGDDATKLLSKIFG